MKFLKQIYALTAFIVVVSSVTSITFAQPYQSSQYKVEEYFFGSGGEVEQTSGTLKSRSSAGNLAGGLANSTSFQIFAGNVTPYEEYLTFVVPSSTINLGTLAANATATGTGTFTVRAHVSSGYIVTTMSDPPTNESGDVLNAKNTLGVPIIGTEEFGMNLVDNSSPNIGANPAPQPDATFANGIAAAGYATVNQFKYTKGDTVASASEGQGQTNYTVSYVANINSITEAGLYVMAHDLVATATF